MHYSHPEVFDAGHKKKQPKYCTLWQSICKFCIFKFYSFQTFNYCCKIRFLLAAKVTRCKRSLFICWTLCSLLTAEVTRCKKYLCICCKICSQLAAEIARCRKFTRHSLQNSLVAHCRSCSLLQTFYNVNKNTTLKENSSFEAFLFYIFCRVSWS